MIVKPSKFIPGQSGVIAKRPFKKGEIIFQVRGPMLTKPTQYSFSAGLNKHIDPIKEDGTFDFGHYLNHSCDPNTFIQIIDGVTPYINIVARRNIAGGEELAFDYASLEYETVTKAECKCGASNCRKLISGFKDLPEDTKVKYINEGMIHTYLLKIKRK